MRRGLLAALIILALGVLPAKASAAAGDITGSLPSGGGIALVVWGGGSTEQFQSAASAKGCTLRAVWVLDQQTQAFVSFVPGAPSIVNSGWNARFAAGIPASELLIASCRAPGESSTSTQQPGSPAAASSSQEREMSRLITQGVNAERMRRGLAAFSESSTLVATAEKYAPTQLQAGRLDHAIDGTEPWDRARALGYGSFTVGEVLAARIFSGPFSIQAEAPKFVQMWLDSPPHRSIIMTEDPRFQFTEIGIGCAISTANGTEIYCVGVTGRP